MQQISIGFDRFFAHFSTVFTQKRIDFRKSVKHLLKSVALPCIMRENWQLCKCLVSRQTTGLIRHTNHEKFRFWCAPYHQPNFFASCFSLCSKWFWFYNVSYETKHFLKSKFGIVQIAFRCRNKKRFLPFFTPWWGTVLAASHAW